MGIVQIIIDKSTSIIVEGTYTFDRDNNGTLIAPSGTSFPVTPEAREWFWRSDESKLYRRNDGNTAWEAATSAVVAHKASHENNGSDEINVAGLSGELADAQIPKAHALDSIYHTGVISDVQHGSRGNGTLHSVATSSVNGFLSSTDKTKVDSLDLALIPTAGEKAALAGTSGTPSDSNRYLTDVDTRNTNARTPTSHKSSHENNGSDELNVAGLNGLLADAQNPTTHALDSAAHSGTISDGQHGSRSGGTLHSAATTSVNGFLSSTDKSKIDDLNLFLIPTSGEKAALAGTSGTPSDSNRYMTDADTRNTNARTPTAHAASHGEGQTDAITLAQSQVTGLSTSLGLKANDADVVHTTGSLNETITGVKTFNSSPLVPSPTLDTQAANRGWVQQQIAEVGGGYAAGVADLTALRAVGSADRLDKQIRLVESKGAIYRFDAEGLGSDDGDFTIVPSDITPPAAGRWFKVQAATQNHEELLGLLGGALNDHYHLTSVQTGYLPGSGVNAALAGTSGTPSDSNRYMTNTDSRNSDARTPTSHKSSHENNGADEINVAGLNGLLADAQNPTTHALDSAAHSGTISDVQHGNRGNGTLHSVATTSVNGFLASTDKTKIDNLDLALIPTSGEKAALAGTSGTPSDSNRYVTHGDTRNTNARTPTAHATSHKNSGSDVILLDEFGAPTDNTNLNVSISAHGLTPKLPNNANQYLNGVGGWTTPAVAVFGTQAQYESDETNSTTTGTTLVSKLLLTTPSLPAGNYRIGWSMELAVSSSNRDYEAVLQIDDVEVALHAERAVVANYFAICNGIYQVTFTAGVHTARLLFRRPGGTSTTITARRARIELWRIS